MAKSQVNDPNPPVWMRIEAAAAYLGLSVQYLYQMRSNKRGPKSFTKVVKGKGRGPSKRVFYTKEALDRWNFQRVKKPKPQRRSKTNGTRTSKAVACEVPL
jgi:hypothetical protein